MKTNQTAVKSHFDWRSFFALLRVIFRGEKKSELFTGGLLQQKTVANKNESKLIALGKKFGRYILIAFAALAMILVFISIGTSIGSTQSPVSIFYISVASLLLISLLFSFFTCINILYYSKDTYFYLKFPISTTTLVAAKFTHYLGTSILGDLSFLLISFSALFVQNAPVATYILMFFGFLAAIVTVNALSAIVIVVLMRFSTFAADKDKFSRFANAFVVVFVMVAGVGFQVFFSGAQADGLLNTLSVFTFNSILASPLGWISILFAPPVLVAEMIFSGQVLLVLAGIALSALFAVLYLFLLSLSAKAFYLPGVQSMQAGGGKKSSKIYAQQELKQVSSARNPVKAFFSVDLARCLRTPSLFSQTVLSRLLQPLYMLALFLVLGYLNLSRYGLDIGGAYAWLVEHARQVSFTSDIFLFLLMAVMGVSFVFVGFLALFSVQAIARDGRDFYYIKALPVDWKSYLFAKLLSELLIAGSVGFLIVLIVLLVFQLPVLISISLLATLFCLSFIQLSFAIAVGTIKPKLTWDSETELFRGADKIILVYASMFMSAATLILPLLTLAFFGITWRFPIALTLSTFAACVALEFAAAYFLLFKFGSKRLSRIQKQ